MLQNYMFEIWPRSRDSHSPVEMKCPDEEFEIVLPDSPSIWLAIDD